MGTFRFDSCSWVFLWTSVLMAIKILNNGIQIGSYTLQETAGGLLFNGAVVARSYFKEKSYQGQQEAFMAGGVNPPVLTMVSSVEKFPFASTTVAGASLFNMGYPTYGGAAASSDTHGYVGGGASPAGNSTQIYKYPFATSNPSATTITVGATYPYYTTVYGPRYNTSGHASAINGYIAGGTFTPGASTNFVERYPFANDNSGQQTSYLTVSRRHISTQSSSNFGYAAGGSDASMFQTIDKFPFVSDSVATSVGNLFIARELASGISSQTNGYVAGGGAPPSFPGTVTAVVDKFPFSTDSNATRVGSLASARWGAGGHSSMSEGYITGGSNTPTIAYGSHTSVSTVDKFAFSNDVGGSAVIGALASARTGHAAHQY